MRDRLNFNRATIVIATLLLNIPILNFANASEGMFGYIYTLDNTPQGSWEYEQKQTLRTGKARGTYSAVDLRNEFEYGLTNDLQVAFYVNSLYLNQQNVPDPENTAQNLENHNEFNVRGASVEFLYRALTPYKNPIGLGFYLEPEISLQQADHGQDQIERAVEGRIILQKNFLDDTLVAAANILLEPEWFKQDGLHQKELYAELTLGATYRFHANWFAGVEVRNHMEYPDMNLGHQEHSAVFAGPNIHYGGENYWWTLSILPQISGWPRNLGNDANEVAVTDPALHLGEHERLEVRFMFGIPLPGEERGSHRD